MESVFLKSQSSFFEGKEFNAEHKSEEEIRRYTLEEDLGELKRVKVILKKGDTIQRSAIFSNLKNYFTWVHADSIAIFDYLFKEIPTQEPESQLEAAKSIQSLLLSEETARKLQENQKEKLFSTTMRILSGKHASVINEWLIVFESLIECPIIFPTFQSLEKSFYEDFFRLAGITSTSLNKATAMSLAGIFINYKKGHVKPEMIEILKLFAQTTENDIKYRLLTFAIGPIYKYLPPQQHESFWNDKLLEFIHDPSISIKCDSIEITARILEHMSEPFKLSKIKPLFFEYAYSKSPEILRIFSRHIGAYIYHLRHALATNPGNQTAIISLLQSYAENESDAIFRVNYLFNLPAALEVYGTKLWTQQAQRTYLNLLLRDDDDRVRIQATQIYPIVFTYFSSSEANLKSLLKQHMRAILIPTAVTAAATTTATTTSTATIPATSSNLLSVVGVTAPIHAGGTTTTTQIPSNLTQISLNMPQCIGQKQIFLRNLQTILIKVSYTSSRAYLSELFKDLLAIQAGLMNSANWRLHAQLITFIEDHFEVFDTLEIVDSYMPQLFEVMLKETAQLRRIAQESLLKCLRLCMNKPTQRDTILTYITNNQYQARSYASKVMYIECIERILNEFEIEELTFRKNNLIIVLAFHFDSLSKIKRMLLPLIPNIYPAVATDKSLMNTLLEGLKQLSEDKDDQVKEATQKVCMEISEQYDEQFMEKVLSYEQQQYHHSAGSFSFREHKNKSLQSIPSDLDADTSSSSTLTTPRKSVILKQSDLKHPKTSPIIGVQSQPLRKSSASTSMLKGTGGNLSSATSNSSSVKAVQQKSLVASAKLNGSMNINNISPQTQNTIKQVQTSSLTSPKSTTTLSSTATIGLSASKSNQQLQMTSSTSASSLSKSKLTSLASKSLANLAKPSIEKESHHLVPQSKIQPPLSSNYQSNSTSSLKSKIQLSK